jgi:hypothetical protein
MAQQNGRLGTQVTWAQSTCALHADSRLRDVSDVAPPLHVTTTFKYAEDMIPLWERPSYMEGNVRLLWRQYHLTPFSCVTKANLVPIFTETVFTIECTNNNKTRDDSRINYQGESHHLLVWMRSIPRTSGKSRN